MHPRRIARIADREHAVEVGVVALIVGHHHGLIRVTQGGYAHFGGTLAGEVDQDVARQGGVTGLSGVERFGLPAALGQQGVRFGFDRGDFGASPFGGGGQGGAAPFGAPAISMVTPERLGPCCVGAGRQCQDLSPG